VGTAIIVAAPGAAGAAVPAQVSALAEGVMKAMFLSKLKVTLAVVLVCCLLGTSAVGLALRAKAGEQSSPTPPADERQTLQPAEEYKRLDKELREVKEELAKMRAELDKLKGQAGAARKPLPAEKEGKPKLTVKVYPVADLVNVGEGDLLAQIISKTIEPKNWTPTGASIEYFEKSESLIISQSAEVHETVQGLLDSLRKAKAELKQKRE
jgi:hypothetical protein